MTVMSRPMWKDIYKEAIAGGPHDFLTNFAFLTNTAIRFVLYIPTCLLTLVSTLTIGIAASVPLVGPLVFFPLSAVWALILGILSGSSLLWYRSPLTRPFLFLPGVMAANVGFTYSSCVPHMGERGQKTLKLSICDSWPHSRSVIQFYLALERIHRQSVEEGNE